MKNISKNKKIPIDFDYTKWYNSKFRQSISGHMALGLLSFAITTFLISFVNADITLNPSQIAHAGGNPHAAGLLIIIIVGMIIGGFTQFVAGLLGFAKKNDRSAVVFCLFGAFWFAFGLLFVFMFNNLLNNSQSTIGDDKIIQIAIGTLLIIYGLMTFMFAIAALWDFITSFLVLFVVFITFILLGIGAIAQNNLSANAINGWNVAGGVFGIFAAGIAFYKGTSYMLESSAGRPILPLGRIILAKHISPLDEEDKTKKSRFVNYGVYNKKDKEEKEN